MNRPYGIQLIVSEQGNFQKCLRGYAGCLRFKMKASKKNPTQPQKEAVCTCEAGHIGPDRLGLINRRAVIRVTGTIFILIYFKICSKNATVLWKLRTFKIKLLD